MIFQVSRVVIVLGLFGFVICNNEEDTSTMFMEAAQALFENKQAINGLQGVAKAFMQSDTGKQVRLLVD